MSHVRMAKTVPDPEDVAVDSGGRPVPNLGIGGGASA